MITRMLIAGLALILASCGSESSGEDVLTRERWTSSENIEIAVTSLGEPPTMLTTDGDDFKPVWSKNGSLITFFRRYERGSGVHEWKTKIVVIDADGTGFRELTSGEYADVNQTFSRDGSNMIIFNRYGVPDMTHNSIYLISPDGNPGDEQLISNPDHRFEWAYSGLKDGRIFVDRTDMTPATGPVAQTFLLTPNPGGRGFYEEVQRPHAEQWSKLSVSPSETKVAYMLDHDKFVGSGADAVLYYADFDVDKLTISNPVQIADDDPSYFDQYPRWTADESLIVYTSNRTGTSQLYAYRLSDGTTHRISPNEDVHSEFACFENTPK